MKISLREKVKALITHLNWELVLYLEDITEDTNCIQFWIPWEDCGAWSTYEEACVDCIQMDDKGRVLWEYSKEDISEMYENMN